MGPRGAFWVFWGSREGLTCQHRVLAISLRSSLLQRSLPGPALLPVPVTMHERGGCAVWLGDSIGWGHGGLGWRMARLLPLPTPSLDQSPLPHHTRPGGFLPHGGWRLARCVSGSA